MPPLAQFLRKVRDAWHREWLRAALPWSPKFNIGAAMGRCRSVRVREYTDADFDACCGIYRRNEPGRFPKGYGQKFADCLTRRTALFVVAEREGQIVALGGISLSRGGPFDLAGLSYGLVDPNYHSQGLGTTMLIARLAALPRPTEFYSIHATTVDRSETFLSRFGFAFGSRVADPQGNEFNQYHVIFYAADWDVCHILLRKAGANLDLTGVVVPPLVAEKGWRRV